MHISHLHYSLPSSWNSVPTQCHNKSMGQLSTLSFSLMLLLFMSLGSTGQSNIYLRIWQCSSWSVHLLCYYVSVELDPLVFLNIWAVMVKSLTLLATFLVVCYQWWSVQCCAIQPLYSTRHLWMMEGWRCFWFLCLKFLLWFAAACFHLRLW